MANSSSDVTATSSTTSSSTTSKPKGKQTPKGTIAIIGAGIVGICTAIEFQRLGYQVTLIDKGEPAGEASKGNASFIAVELFQPQATPSNIWSAIKNTFHTNAAFKVTQDNLIGFIPWGIKFLTQAQRAKREQSKQATIALHKHALNAWKDILQRSGNQDMMHNCGFLKTWENENALEAIKQNQIEEQKHGYDCEILSGEALYKKEPALTKRIKHALYFPNAQQLLEPHQTVIKLFEYFKQQGGEFLKTEVQSIDLPQGEVSLKTANGTQQFDQAVICSGVWSKKLCEELSEDLSETQNGKAENKHKLHIPLVPERGYHLTFIDNDIDNSADNNIDNNIKTKHIIMSAERNVALTPLSTGMRITGFGEFSTLKSATVTKRYQRLRQHINEMIKGMQAQQQTPETWIGSRPTLPDSLPVIDTHPQYSQLGMVFGHQHLGVTQAPISAKIIVALMNRAMMNGEESDQTLANFEDVIESFAVDRF